MPEPDEATLVAILGATTGAPGEEPQPVLDGAAVLRLREEVRAVEIAEPLVHHIARLVRATQPDAPEACDAARRFVRYGTGVRAGQAIALAAKACALLDGRSHVSFADIRRAAPPAMRHRLVLNFEGEAEGVHADRIVQETLAHVPEVPDEVSRLA